VAGHIHKVTRAKVAVFTSAVDVSQTETKGTVLIKSADEMLNFTTGEEKHLEKARQTHPSTFFYLILHFPSWPSTDR
jgi:hypothetical protein